MLSSFESYSQTIYAFLDEAESVRSHTVRIYSRGARTGILEGKVEFEQGIVLRVYERLDFARQELWPIRTILKNILTMPHWPAVFLITFYFSFVFPAVNSAE